LLKEKVETVLGMGAGSVWAGRRRNPDPGNPDPGNPDPGQGDRAIARSPTPLRATAIALPKPNSPISKGCDRHRTDCHRADRHRTDCHRADRHCADRHRATVNQQRDQIFNQNEENGDRRIMKSSK
jgi:hypothetical protein